MEGKRGAGFGRYDDRDIDTFKDTEHYLAPSRAMCKGLGDLSRDWPQEFSSTFILHSIILS